MLRPATTGDEPGVDTSSESGLECRICTGGFEANNPMIMPCACTTPCHLECLKTWIQTRPAQADETERYKCEICRVEYRVEYKRRFVWSCQRCMTSESLQNVFEGFVLLIVMFGNYQSLNMLLRSDEWTHMSATERILVWSMSLLIAPLFVWVLRKIFMRWYEANSEMSLQPVEGGAAPLEAIDAPEEQTHASAASEPAPSDDSVDSSSLHVEDGYPRRDRRALGGRYREVCQSDEEMALQLLQDNNINSSENVLSNPPDSCT